LPLVCKHDDNWFHTGISEPCDMDNNADRIPYFWFYQYLGENTTAKIVAVSQEKNKVSGRISDILEDDTVLMFHNQHSSRYFELVCIAKESEPDPLRYTV